MATKQPKVTEPMQMYKNIPMPLMAAEASTSSYERINQIKQWTLNISNGLVVDKLA